MGGVITPPLKLLDSVSFGIDGEWVGPATRFTSGWGYTRYELPPVGDVALRRIDVAPDDRRGALLGLRLTNTSRQKQTVEVMVDAHSELMTQYPWGFDRPPDQQPNMPHASDNAPDTGAFDRDRLVFRDTGRLPGEDASHSYTAIVGADRAPVGGEAGPGHYGPFGDGRRCVANQMPAPMPRECDDGPFGRGTGGQLRYRIKLRGHDAETLWVAVAGSENSVGEARSEFARLTRRPERLVAEKLASRRALARWSRVQLPGDPQLQESLEWGKQNLADLTQTAEDVDLRWTDEAREWTPEGSLREMTWIGAGFPDYPWLFGVDGEYTAHAAVTLGQFEAIKEHMRALRDISDQLSDRSGVVVHEVVADGSIWHGKDLRRVNPATGQVVYDFNTDEIVKFPAAVALIWRWTGDDRFRDEMLDFTRRNLEYVRTRLDEDADGWPEGNGNVERPGMGEEKLDNAVYYIRGLYDYADMARSAGQAANARAAEERAGELAGRFEETWWIEAEGAYGDSLGDDGEPINQKHWIGADPMEAELYVDGEFVPGLASLEHGSAALATRENNCYSGERPGNRGLFHTGCGGGPDRRGRVRHLLARHRRDGRGRGQLRASRPRSAAALHRRQRGDAVRAAGDRRDARTSSPARCRRSSSSQPVARRHRHAAEHRPLLDLPVDVHAVLGPLRHRLGGRPPAARRAAGPRPRPARGRAAAARRPAERRRARDIRLGRGSIDVSAAHDGARHTTQTDTSDARIAHAPDRPHAAARRGRRVGRARRARDERLRDARDQPRTRGAGRGRPAQAPHAGRHDGRLGQGTPGAARAGRAASGR